MGQLHSKELEPVDGLTPDILKRRLMREQIARAEAEHLLEEKSRELFTTNHVLKKTAEVLEDQRSQLNIILDHTIAAIFLANSDLTLCRANKAAKDLFGLDDESLMEFSIPDLIIDLNVAEALASANTENKALSEHSLREAEARRSDGAEFPVEYGVAKLAHKNRNHTVWIFRDITERKMAELKREALEKELNHAQKMEALGTLASGVAHEINTPVQYVSDNVRFLQDAISDMAEHIALYQTLAQTVASLPDVAPLLAKIEAHKSEIDLEFLQEEAPLSIEQSLHGIKQVASIVNAIKEFSHPNDDDRVPVNINKAIETTLTVSRNQWKYVADVSLDLQETMPEIMAAPGAINQMLLNIICNAADAIADFRKGEMGQISIATSSCDHGVEIRITDNGGGIPDGVKDKIFDPFFTTKDVGKGTGQGLAICDTIVRQKHGGSIEFETMVGEGTSFIIFQPRSPKSEA